MKTHYLCSLALLVGLTACDDDTKPTPGETGTIWGDGYDDTVDLDGDGVTEADGDCDDSDPTIHPGQEEDCNGIDDNCNDHVDEGMSDLDFDGIADCMDEEECDGIDNDGDSNVDEGFVDTDGDGTPDCLSEEICDGIDNNGVDGIDEGFDADGDGFTSCGAATREADCDDTNGDVYPGATEAIGDLVDNDCDGLIDENGAWREGDLVIVEVMNNPAAVLDPDGEWIEVYNASSRELILNGLIITSSVDDDWHQIVSDELLVVEPDEHFVLGSNAEITDNGGADVGYEWTNDAGDPEVVLSNETDDVIIMAGDELIAELYWDDGATMPDVSGASMSLDRWYYDEYYLDDWWCASTQAWSDFSDLGSPAELNEFCSTFDHDGDGYSGDEGDCDDGDETIYPGAPEITAGVDNDCDGEEEAMPTASASYDPDSSLYSCDVLVLDGTESYDPDGDPLTYEWELTSAPADSARTTSDIEEATDASPSFYPDVAGTYTFSLTVNDGGTDSYVDTLTVTITERTDNSNPVADAGDDVSGRGSASCTAMSYGAYYDCSDCSDYDFDLDGTGSSDPDGDSIETYSWEITDGDLSYFSITDEDTSTPTVIASGTPAEYGVDTEYWVDVTLTVTDCMGATDDDVVTLTYTCTGT